MRVILLPVNSFPLCNIPYPQSKQITSPTIKSINMLLFKRAKNIYILLCMFFLYPFCLTAQQSIPPADTFRITLQQAEKVFLDSNLQLLAQHYNIKSAQALVEQARKWENPTLITDQNVYANGKFIHHGKNADGTDDGQVFVQVQQLIKTAGKRGKQIAIAKTNVNQAEWQFKNVLRNLRATLRKDFYTIAQLQGNAALFDDNMLRLTKLQSAMEGELAAGNIARKEYLRVQALIISLKQDMTDNAKDLMDAESELKTLLQMSGNVFIAPVADENEPIKPPATGFASIMDSARHNNTDYMLEIYQLQYNRQNLALQKALAVPDLTLGPEFDQSSNYAPNYYGLSVSLPIPILDRNKGNIKSAGFQVKMEEAMMKEADSKLQNDVSGAFQKLMLNIKLASAANESFYKDYYQLYKNIIESYNNRQISMIEFLEYFNDYQDVRKNQLQQVLNFRLAKQDLNDIVGVDIAN
jgi:cobalt-zinc-cadmium efflux system outer membrane protein